ncbi:MAG: TlpA family protein disulfide reductase [Bacteroidetes bacterium]|jgi:thiol-disulfide isomerase/thioredoxin|nr:TlpA family protein disulfide reductase [Bacteroidota bacterium]
MKLLQGVILTTGIWRAVLLTPGGELPFGMEIKNNQHPVVYLLNGDERIEVNEVSISNDSLIMRLPLYDSEIHAAIKEKELDGYWVNLSRKNKPELPFKAVAGNHHRFNECTSSRQLPEKWRMMFSPESKDSSAAVGIIHQQGNHINTAILTPSGDYRYLEGSLCGDSLFLSYFDGAFAYLFKAKVSDNKIEGMFYAGNHWQEKFEAFADANATLPDPYSLTFMKDKNASFTLEALRTDSTLFRFPDKKYEGKVVLIEIMGTWCPNCMDEAAFLADFYKRYQNSDVAIIGLAFEKTKDFSKSVENINRMRNRFHTPYEVMLGGALDTVKEKLNMFNRLNGYPTTVFIDKKGKVRQIHTGFNGPATGVYYEKTKDDFINLTNSLLKE